MTFCKNEQSDFGKVGKWTLAFLKNGQWTLDPPPFQSQFENHAQNSFRLNDNAIHPVAMLINKTRMQNLFNQQALQFDAPKKSQLSRKFVIKMTK